MIHLLQLGTSSSSISFLTGIGSAGLPMSLTTAGGFTIINEVINELTMQIYNKWEQTILERTTNN